MPAPDEPELPKEPIDVLRAVLFMIDDARGHLEQAQAALATATVIGRITLTRAAENNDNDDDPPIPRGSRSE